MKFLEMDLEEIIYKTDNKDLYNAGLIIYGKKYRQLRIGNYGIADLVTFSKIYDANEDWSKHYPVLSINVIELKKEKVGISAFLQAIRYCKGIEQYIKSRGKNIRLKFHITLIGKEVDLNSDYIYLSSFLTYDLDPNGLSIHNYSYNYDFNGIKFKIKHGYSLKNEGFKNLSK